MPNDNDMRRMQQEAVQRVNEMQSRARRHLREEPPEESRPPEEHREELPAVAEEPIRQSGAIAPPAPGATLFDGLMQDSERTLILMLILLLFTEKADTSVIFSLLYLIL